MSDTPTSGIVAAMLAVQHAAPTMPKDGLNPHFKSAYTPLDTIVEIITPHLCANGLVWSAYPSTDAQGEPSLKYRLDHVGGEHREGEMKLLLVKTDPQGQGSAITYARRYAMLAALNLVADADDDGEGAGHGEPAAPKAAKSKAKAKPAAPKTNTIPDAEVHALAAIYAVTGWKDSSQEDPHATLRMQLAAVGAGNVGDVKDCIRALTVEQGKTVREALEEARDQAKTA